MIKSFAYSFKEAFKQMGRNKVMTLVSFISIAAMLLILGMFIFLSVNVNYMTESLKNEFNTIEAFLEDDVNESDAMAIAKGFGSMTEIQGIEYISKEQALEEFKERWGDNAYLLDTLTENPLPNSLRITLADLAGGELVAELCRTTPGVEDVRYYQTEVNKILRIADLVQKGAMIVIAFLIVVSIVVVSNTIKLTVMARQQEIRIMKAVGATNWFVRGPFLFEGVLLGTVSALIAFGAADFIYTKLTELFSDQALALFSGSLVDSKFMMVNLIWIFLSLGISIGSFGSLISIRRFLES